jgi:proline iminopeptidase
MMRFVAVCTLLLLTLGCSHYDSEGDYFFVRNRGADMPVWVTGDATSDTIVLFLHGGPGGDAATASLFPAFQQLGERFRLAYWDQRASGLSQGNPSKDTYTVEQFVGDTDLVIDVLRERYKPSRLILFGHSWGGALGVAYLADAARQTKVDAFIMEDAGYNLVDGLPASGRWMRDYAQEQIDAKHDVAMWSELRDWLNTAPDFRVEANYRRLDASYSVQGRRDAYYFDPSHKNVGPDSAFILTSFASLALVFGGTSLRETFNILALNLTDDLAHIMVPTLVLWGEHDGVNTLEMGQIAFDKLGAPSKQWVAFAQSGHQPFAEEPAKFVAAFSAFVDGLAL